MQDIQIVDTPHGKMLLGNYIEGDIKCSIRIRLYDFENYGKVLIHEDNVVYIDDFECRNQLKGQKGQGQGRGKKLLFTVLNYIRDIKGPTTCVTLLASSKIWANGSDEALMRYYSQLGFQEIDMVPGLMYANIETVMRSCSPAEFQPAAVAAAAVATTAAAAAAPSTRVQPAGEAQFSSSEEPDYYPYSVSSSQSSQSSRSSDDSSRGVRDTSVPPSKRLGGKKNHTNRKYTMKTRKNKKSKKGWSLKYKKSINCKRPRGFSQRQYCKYGLKKI